VNLYVTRFSIYLCTHILSSSLEFSKKVTSRSCDMAGNGPTHKHECKPLLDLKPLPSPFIMPTSDEQVYTGPGPNRPAEHVKQFMQDLTYWLTSGQGQIPYPESLDHLLILCSHPLSARHRWSTSTVLLLAGSLSQFSCLVTYELLFWWGSTRKTQNCKWFWGLVNICAHKVPLLLRRWRFWVLRTFQPPNSQFWGCNGWVF
jgi:hypothetical protein